MTNSCAAGEACDIANNDWLFHCFPPPNVAGIGATCDAQAGPFCSHGGTCVSNSCAAYCCANADCLVGTCQSAGMAGNIEIKVCL